MIIDQDKRAELQRQAKRNILLELRALSRQHESLNSQPVARTMDAHDGGDFITGLRGVANGTGATTPFIPDKEAISAAELARFLADVSDGSFPLDFWRKNSQRYELLSRLEQKYLCVSASSVPCERLFS